MRKALNLYYGLHHLARELMKFGVVGSVAFIADITLFNVFRLVLEFGPLTSKTLSVVVATTIAYFGNRHWTFRHRGRQGLGKEYSLFFGLNAIGLVIALSVLGFSHYALGFHSALADNVAANVVGLGLATTFRFWSYRRWVFPHVETPAPQAQRPAASAASAA